MRSPAIIYVALQLCACSPDEADSQPPPQAAQNERTPTGESDGVVPPAVDRAITARTSTLTARVSSFPVVINMPSDALFDFDRSTLSAAATGELWKAADAIRSGGPGEITISGHTDAKGSDAYNQDLSQRRATAVEAWMREQVGVRLRHFRVVGMGESQPVAPNARPDGTDDPDGRRRNRRVEIVIPPAS